MTNTELMELILGEAPAQIALAQGSLKTLAAMSAKNLEGLTPLQAAKVSAIFELGRRSRTEPGQRVKITKSADAADVLERYLKDLDREKFFILCLNNEFAVIAVEEISVGGVAATIVDPKVVFRTALAKNASAIILAHNHPSGQTKPSQEDRDLTAKIASIGMALQMKVLDHIIIGDNYFSFGDEGLI
jgi:DNA repair protein RadC